MPIRRKLLTTVVAIASLSGLPLLASSQPRPAASPPPAMQAILDAHNNHRAKHCIPPLTWSAEIAASAQQWANRCDFNHEDASPLGENLFWGTAGAYSQQDVVVSWYEEIQAYNFAAPAINDDTGHFTQVIWRSSKLLGCARAACKGNDFWVCRYSPAGNYDGRLPQNVPKPCR